MDAAFNNRNNATKVNRGPESAISFLRQEAAAARMQSAGWTRQALQHTGQALNPVRLLRRHPVATCAGVLGIAVGMLSLRQLRDYRATPAQRRPRRAMTALHRAGHAIFVDSVRMIRNAVLGGLISRALLILQPIVPPPPAPAPDSGPANV